MICRSCGRWDTLGTRPREANYVELGRLWYRCHACGALWDADSGEDVLKRYPNLVFSEAKLLDYRARRGLA